MSGGFEDLGLLPELVRAVQELGWVLPSDVQDEAIPLILGGGDVMVAAETGSGKTGAFALPAIQLVHETRRGIASGAGGAPSTAAVSEGGASTLGSAKRPRMEAVVRLNPHDRSPFMAVHENGLVCQCRQERDWGGVRANYGVLTGKVYYEAQVRDEGLCRFGWSTQAGSLDLGTDRNGYGYGATGKKSHDKRFDAWGEPFASGDTIGCYLDVTNGKGGQVSFSKNGRHLGEAFTIGKVTGAIFPAICMKNAECAVVFDEGAFRFPPAADTGYTAIAALPPSQLVAGPEGGRSTAAAGGAGSHKAGDYVGPVCIILEPARDLAEQTHTEVSRMCKFVSTPSVTPALIMGGVDGRETARQLAANPDVITATPAKFMELVESRKVSLAQVRLFILDEADRFTEEENLKLVHRIFNAIRSSIDTATAPGRLQVCFFSATLHSPEITSLSESLCKNPTWVDLKGKDSVPDTVHHVIVPIDPDADRSWATHPTTLDPQYAVKTDGVHSADHIGGAGAGGAGSRGLTAEEASEGVKRLKPRLLVNLIDSLQMEQCLIFCRTNLDCDHLEAYLTEVGGGGKLAVGAEKGKENPYSAVVLAGGRDMADRRRNLEAFRAGSVRFLICTDVAARGLDIKELPYVVNMTLPDETENYIHRIGRVGRADNMGLAISFVSTVKEKVWYHSCGKPRGKGCHDTRLADKGGCCIWYDEPALLTAVQKRLGMAATGIPRMAVVRDGALPGTAGGRKIAYLFSLPPGMGEGVVYGSGKGEAASTSVHVDAIRDQVETLAGLEVHAQSNFLALKMKYAPDGGRGKAVGGAGAGGGTGSPSLAA